MTEPMEWRAAGACLSADPDLFFPIATSVVARNQIARAQRICAGCRVRQQCLDFAMRTGEFHGIWGTPRRRSGSACAGRNCAAAALSGPGRQAGSPGARAS